jgi:acyl carrier protein
MINSEPAIPNNVAREKEILRIWQKALKNDRLTIDDDFFEAGGDSLLAMQVLLEIENLTGKSLHPSTIFETGTVRQMLGKVTSTEEIKHKTSVLIGSENGKVIHYFHGDFDNGGISVKAFSRILGTNYLINSIAPHLPHEGELPKSIEDMAKERLTNILKEQPDGQYIIIGDCNGALVGFEAARQLVSMGKKVKAVVMVDPLIASVRISSQLIFIIADFCMRLMNMNKGTRRLHLIRIWGKLVELDFHTKDTGYHSLFFFKKMWFERKTSFNKFLIWMGKKLMALNNRIKTIRRRSLSFLKKTSPQKRATLDNLLNFIRKRLTLNVINHDLKNNVAFHYTNAFFDYKPLSLNVPTLYISLAYRGYAWRRITKNVVFINIHGGRHVPPWNENYSKDLVDKIREFINC